MELGEMELTWEVGIDAKALCTVSSPAHRPNQLIQSTRRLDKKDQFWCRDLSEILKTVMRSMCKRF